MQIVKIINLLRKEIGPTTFFTAEPFKALITTVLSQRTKDANTERASKQLFSKFKNARQLSNSSLKEIEKLIRPSGFYKTKAKRIREISRILLRDFSGKVPRTIEELLELPGVGRKTANCVLVFAFRKPAIPVDTHVHRITNRIGIVETKTPERTEVELMKIVPKKYWVEINSLLVRFGQRKCLPRNPKCWICPLRKFCSYYQHRRRAGTADVE